MQTKRFNQGLGKTSRFVGYDSPGQHLPIKFVQQLFDTPEKLGFLAQMVLVIIKELLSQGTGRGLLKG